MMTSKKNISKILALSLLLITHSALAAPPLKRLIQTSPNLKSWFNEDQISALSAKIHAQGRCGGFMDITGRPEKKSLFLRPLEVEADRRPTELETVHRLLPELSAAKLLSSVEKLSSYKNRYYQSNSGKKAAEWVHGQFKEIAHGRSDIEVSYVQHNFLQPSVIARIQGQGEKAKQVVILGAHVDSINAKSIPIFINHSSAPGADDDASGIATLLETFRVLSRSGYQPERTIEFIAYAGEERGLLGSQDIAAQYQKEQRQVFGVIQFDMTLYAGNGHEIHFVTDNVDSNLTLFTKKLVEEYVKVPWRDLKCGYGCSDHASWDELGYAAVFPFESTFEKHNPKIHTSGDTIGNQLDSAFGLHFAKLALAFSIEMASGN